jgi:anti-anti-sigma factor
MRESSTAPFQNSGIKLSFLMEHSRRTWTLNVTSLQVPGGIVVAAQGRIGAANAPDFAAALAAAAAVAGRLVVDLEGVDYLSGAGIAALDDAAHSVDETIVCGLSEPVRITLQLAGLLDTLTVEAARPDAIARLSAPPVSAKPAPLPRSS